MAAGASYPLAGPHILHSRRGPPPAQLLSASAPRNGSRLPLADASHGLYPMTSNPMDRAVPRTVLTADSSESQFRSGSFVLAMSSTCFAVTVPTLFLFGSADPLAMFAARFSSTAAGGVFVMNVYERSAYTVTTTGMMRPSSFAVLALKFLQKSMMLTPCGPSAVPTGGAGVALPAAIWSFTIACIFLAITLGISHENTKARNPTAHFVISCFRGSNLLNL